MGYESRPKRFARIVEDLQTNIGLLTELKDEYEQWKDSMPENLEQSPTGQKLEETVDTLDTAIDTLDNILSESENVVSDLECCELPMGFGNDQD